MNKFISLILFFLIFVNCIYGQIYVAVDGNDDNPGTLQEPYGTFAKAISVITPGDTIYVRGGVYDLVNTITISIVHSGTEGQLCTLTAYKDEEAVLDFSGQLFGKKGISLQSNYWHIKGLQITNAGDNGMQINYGSNNIIEQCQFYRNKDTGLQLSNGSSDNQIINCDSYYNADPPDYGDADGFAPKLTVGSGNYFYGCRSWANCDDGWDGYLRGADSVFTTLVNCWTWGNGYREDGSDPGPQANGNGFKMGGGDNSNSDLLMHNFTLINCVSFGNKNKGFDQNNNVGSMTLYNCTGYGNLTANYRIQRALNPGQVLTVKNCLSFNGNGLNSGVQLGSFAVQETNSWLAPFDVTSDDFVSLDIESASAPRQADGSLPEINLLHLAQGSDLIDAGVDLGYPYNGLAPDLGAFESSYVTSYVDKPVLPGNYKLMQNYPNPFNPVTTIKFFTPLAGNVNVSVYNAAGQWIATLIDKHVGEGYHYVNFNADVYPSGIYFYRLKTNNYISTRKMLLVK